MLWPLSQQSQKAGGAPGPLSLMSGRRGNATVLHEEWNAHGSRCGWRAIEELVEEVDWESTEREGGSGDDCGRERWGE
jgi:hypothetical protein